MTETIQIMITCLMDTFFPEAGEAMVKVLERAGLKVEFPEKQTCCGQPAFNAGLRSEAKKMAIHTIKVFEESKGNIIIPSGSCASMIKHGYPELFANDPMMFRRATTLAKRVYEFSQYLVDVMNIRDVGAIWRGKLTYHPSCHLMRGLGVDQQPRTLLSHVREAEIVDLPNEEDCCGFGGIFSIEHPELSAEMLSRKIMNIEDSTSPTLVVCDSGCLMHIQGGLIHGGRKQKVVHIAEILANVELGE